MTTPSLADVEAYVASGRKDIAFPPSIEDAFRAHRRRYRSKAMQTSILPSLVCYNVFLPADCFLLPHTSWLAIILHALVSLWIIFAGVMFRKQTPLFICEALAVSLPMIMVAQILAIYGLNEGAPAQEYQYLAIMVVVYMNVNVRPDFRFAAAASAGLGALYLMALVAGHAPVAVKLVGSTSMVAAIYLTLTANYRMERDGRYTFLRRLQDQLGRVVAEGEAHRDPLTGLFNRRHLDIEGARLWTGVGDSATMAALLLDVDHFKAFNDRYGHVAGDSCLKRVAGAILSELRDETDIAVRYGGEEFLVLMPCTDLGPALQVAERIRRTVADRAIPHEARGSDGYVTVSLGVMAGPASDYSLAELTAGADAALYAAKRSGRDKVWPPFVAETSTVAALQLKDAGRLRAV